VRKSVRADACAALSDFFLTVFFITCVLANCRRDCGPSGVGAPASRLAPLSGSESGDHRPVTPQ
jgi:hypothetical protein